MSLAPKTPTYPACYGVACDLHKRCQRWHAVEKVGPDIHTMGTCLDGEGFPEFVEIKPVPLADLAVEARQA